MIWGFVGCFVDFEEEECLWIYIIFGFRVFVFEICFSIERYEVYVESIVDNGCK